MPNAETSHLRVRSPLMPTWSEARDLMRIWDGIPRADVDEMRRDIVEQTGTPQAQVDWSNPERWIPERLTGRSRELAERILRETGGRVTAAGRLRRAG